jgi:hypothetical protein
VENKSWSVAERAVTVLLTSHKLHQHGSVSRLFFQMNEAETPPSWIFSSGYFISALFPSSKKREPTAGYSRSCRIKLAPTCLSLFDGEANFA